MKQVKFVHGPEFKLADDGSGDWIVEGYASTSAVDSYNEIVEPSAFASTLSRFGEFPVVLLNHAWFDKPVGKILSAEIHSGGLWVRALISKSAPEVWNLIAEGVLKAFSIGFQGVTVERHTDGSPDVWKEIELLEISVVNVPANREALFSVANSKGISLSRFTSKSVNQVVPNQTKTGGAEMDNLTPEQVKAIAGDAINAANIPSTVLTAANVNAEAIAKRHVSEVEVRLGTVESEIKAFKEASANAKTDAELKAIVDNALQPLMPLVAEHQRRGARGLENVASDSYFKAKTAPLTQLEQTVAEELRISKSQTRFMLHKPEHVLAPSDARIEQMQSAQEAHDNMYLLHCLFSANSRTYSGPQSLKYYHEVYKPAMAPFVKAGAMDTAESTGGTEWIPVGMTADFLTVFELALQVAPLFRTFPMPTKTYDWPIQSGKTTVYLPGESTSDTATAIVTAQPTTAKITFTAKKLAARTMTSTELIEDSIVAILPFLRSELAIALARGVDETILNGDTAGTHEDSDVTAGTDRRKAWLGLRAWCNDQSNKTDTGAFTVADLGTVRAAMGKFGVDQSKLAFIVSPAQYLAAVQDTAIATVDKWGTAAPYLTGFLAAFMGAPLIASEFVRTNLNASGVYDGVTTTKSAIYCVSRDNWMIGDRRMLTMDVEKVIETDQFQIVGTIRKDFQSMRPTTDDHAWIGYNVS